MNKEKVAVSIVGITGYTGEELLKVLARHPHVKIAALASRSETPVPLGDLYPHLAHLGLSSENLTPGQVAERSDIIFLALPHRVSFEIVPEFMKLGKKVIDLSADFRLDSADEYEKWYGSKHTADVYLKEAVYGLPELYRKEIRGARLIANPGCYPTTVILGTAPVLKNKLVDLSSIIIDSKSGISGAGRKSVAEYYKNEHPNFRAYNIAGAHRHTPEIEQEISKVAGEPITVTFTPHIIPTERGMFSTIYMNLKKHVSSEELTALYKEFYKDEPFAQVLPQGKLPQIKSVMNNNFCDIGLKVDERTNRLIVVSAIDNLVKGASGQAIQNMNIMCGFDERDGLI